MLGSNGLVSSVRSVFEEFSISTNKAKILPKIYQLYALQRYCKWIKDERKGDLRRSIACHSGGFDTGLNWLFFVRLLYAVVYGE